MNYFEEILLRIVMKTVIWKKIYGLKCLHSLLLFSHFPQSTLKKGFHSITHLTSVTETDESDSNEDMNQNGSHSNADYSQVNNIPICLNWPNFILQRIVKDKIETI